MERNNQEFKKKLIADSFGFSKLDILMNQVVELSKILGSSIATLKGKKKL